MISWIDNSFRWLRRNIFYVLDVLKFSGILILMVMLVNLNARSAQQAKDTNKVVESQNQVLESQGRILIAIEQLAKDNKLTSEEKTNTIICMLQLDIKERTVDVLEDCKVQAIESAREGTNPTPNQTYVEPPAPKVLALLRA